jgi:(p)ppGpp synthase/HD superfamily hydrolase
MMDYSISCKYSVRLIEKLKLLDTKNVLDFEVINKAISFAKKYHQGQLRKSGEPFYSHPLEVAYIISDYNLKTDVIAASILHDIVEDTEVTIKIILENFGPRIAEMVDRLTRDRPDRSKLSIKELLNNAYELRDQEVLLIKLIDRLHNIRTIKSMSAQKIEKIVAETLTNFIASSIYLGLLEVEQQLTESCMYYYSKQKNKPYKKKSIFSFNDNNSPLLSLIS